MFTLINGGPGSAIHRSEDGGKTWKKATGLPGVELGRIGLARAPSDPDVMYAIVEAPKGKSGTYRSTDGGRTWKRRSDHVSSSPQYYQELVVDPGDPDRVYSLSTYMHRSDDGGKTWFRYPENTKHVDNHALWIDPRDSRHLIAGCDGGVYQSWDMGSTWRFCANLPLTQFYRATPDNDLPFYNVYAGTQDNATQGGPSRTRNRRGIRNADWFLTVFGDGFKTQIDPENPDIVYSQWQYGGLVRYDRKTGVAIDIKPQSTPGEPAQKFNWDAPLIISPHSHKRLYYASQRVYRSDEYGDSWTPVSGDLTRQIDRNKLEVMGRVWGVDSVSKNRSTSFYGNIVALSESPLVEGLLYAGTDDGLIQVSEDGGASWRKVEAFDGVPEHTYVAALIASLHDPHTVYAAFNDHKRGNFAPYLMKSTDRGKTFTSIASNLPERGSTYSFAEDHVDANLLFCGTEFGLFFTQDGGKNWIQLKGGLPTVAIRDLEIQRRENDLVLASFGRGIYILDDYSPLRQLNGESLAQDAVLIAPRTAHIFALQGDYDTRFQGDDHYTADNPPFGAVATFHLKRGLETKKEVREKKERELAKEGKDVPYPSWEELRAEEREIAPRVQLHVKDSTGREIRVLDVSRSSGLHRTAWDLRLPSGGRFGSGPFVKPGTYTMELTQSVAGKRTPLAGPASFEVQRLEQGTFEIEDHEEVFAFKSKVLELQRSVQAFSRSLGEARERIDGMIDAVKDTPGLESALLEKARAIETKLHALETEWNGDRVIGSRSEPTPITLQGRMRALSSVFGSTENPTGTQRTLHDQVSEGLAPLMTRLRALHEKDLAELGTELDAKNVRWTTGRIPR